MLGRHAVKHWASTQTSVTLSSGEAEFAGVIRDAGQGLGYQALLKDLGIDLPLRVWTDSSAAIGICSRQGLGKLRHLDTHTLWIQQAVRTGRIDLRKVDGEVNPADLFTKHPASRQRLDLLTDLFGCRYLDGRAASAPRVKQGDSGRVTMAEAHGDANEVGSGVPSVILPHLEFTPADLDHRYPPLQAPDEDHLGDLQEDSHDTVLKAGMAIAQDIRKQGQTEGRRRRPNTDESCDDGTSDGQTFAHRSV
jgi:hypothetical protein